MCRDAVAGRASNGMPAGRAWRMPRNDAWTAHRHVERLLAKRKKSGLWQRVVS
jgi:hypothetical protein